MLDDYDADEMKKRVVGVIWRDPSLNLSAACFRRSLAGPALAD